MSLLNYVRWYMNMNMNMNMSACVMRFSMLLRQDNGPCESRM